jgi:hypothetical protein
MPIHDWTRVDAGLFHHFHQNWIPQLCTALNAGRLPAEYFALVEQNIGGPITDVLALKLSEPEEPPKGGPSAMAVETASPRTRVIRSNEADLYAAKADRISVRHRHGNVVAVLEIVSPGNKGNQVEFEAFVRKSAALIRQGVHLLVVDLFPPTKRDPEGMAKAIWDQFVEEGLDLPADKPLSAVSFDAGPPRMMYLEPLAVGDALPEIPLFLQPGHYVRAPLETTYQATWDIFPSPLKRLFKVPAGGRNSEETGAQLE